MSNDVSTILVFGIDEKNRLTDTVFEAGYVPIVRDTMNEAIFKIRHEAFIAVIVEQDQIEDDTLEFILNVRDSDKLIPVFIAGMSKNKEEKQLLSRQQNTFLIGENYSLLKQQIKKLFDN